MPKASIKIHQLNFVEFNVNAMIDNAQHTVGGPVIILFLPLPHTHLISSLP